MTMDDRYPITCFSMNGGDIRLVQHDLNSFTVFYGMVEDNELSYGQAAARLGEAIMHHAACEYRLINTADDETPDTDQIDPA
jgi:hypothetical protein